MSHMPQLGRLPAITPVALPAGNTNNHAPVDATSGDSFSAYDVIRQATNAAGSNLTGLLAQAAGDFVIIENLGPGNLTLIHESFNSTDANRFITPGSVDYVMPPGGAAWLWRDGISLRWRLTATPPAASVSGIGAGSVNKVAKFTSGTAVGNSNITDDGSTVKIVGTLVTQGITSLTLGAGPLDVDRASTDMVVSIIPAATGTTIRSFKTVGSGLAGELLIIRNNGNSIVPKDYLIRITQDDPAGTFTHFHLGGRQPWMIIPCLESAIFQFHTDDNKWHPLCTGNFGSGKRPIPIFPATMANANVNDWSPTDNATGLSHQFADWIQATPQAATRLCGFDTTITAGSNYSRRVLLTNFGGPNAVIAHNNSSGGTSTRPIFCPGGTDFTWRAWASVWIVYEESNHIWLLEGA